MAFFELPPPPEEEPDYRQPVWMGPPENVLGTPVPLRLLLARTDDVAVGLVGVVAFTNGFELRTVIRLRNADPGKPDPDMMFLHRHGRLTELPPELFRFGIELSDGRKATTLGAAWLTKPDEVPEGPVLVQRGGGGGGRSWSFDYWVWPLPPPGSLALVCEWPAKGIGLTRVEVEAEPILRAAEKAEVLWEEAPGPVTRTISRRS